MIYRWLIKVGGKYCKVTYLLANVVNTRKLGQTMTDLVLFENRKIPLNQFFPKEPKVCEKDGKQQQ